MGGVTLLCQTKNGSLLLFPEGKYKEKEYTLVLLSVSEDSKEDNVLSWPGEYDYDGISIRAIGKDSKNQVSYIITVDGIRCGFISSPMQDFAEADEEIIGDLDVLVIPADDVKRVQKLVEDVDPRVVIPIKTNDEKTFIEVVAACGGKDVEEVSEVKLKKSGLPTETRKVYVLKEKK